MLHKVRILRENLQQQEAFKNNLLTIESYVTLLLPNAGITNLDLIAAANTLMIMISEMLREK